MNMKGFKLEKSDKYGKYYSRNNETLDFEGLNLKSVTYKTYENKFHMVIATFVGQKSFESLASNFKTQDSEHSELKSEFGSMKDIQYSWYFYHFGKGTKKHIATVRLNFNFENNKGEFTWSSIQYGPPLPLF